MRQTQLYLDDQLWNALQMRARIQKTTMSDLVREAVREKYLGSQEERTKAMQELEKLSRLFNSLTCVPVDLKVGEKAGHYLRQYGKSHAVELGDALIAATAVESGAVLWTRNRRHYPMQEIAFFEGLQPAPRIY